MSHFSYSETDGDAVFFMIIKGMYTIKEALGFEKKQRPLLLPSGLWSVDGLEIFFGQFM